MKVLTHMKSVFQKRVLILFLLFTVATALLITFIIFFTDLLLEKDLLENPPAKRCSECHISIYKQWKRSRHSVAWTTKNFKKESENYKKQKCMGCHNPLVISFSQKPEQRGFHLDDGVSCLACHFRGEKMLGPYDLFAPPHPTERNTGYLQSEFCKGCHIKTFKEWKKTDSRTTCQSCHMKIYTGKMMDRFPHRLLHFSRNVGDHSWPVLELTAEEFTLKASIEKDTLVVELENREVLHDLPTAQNGDPRLYLEIFFTNLQGEEIEKNKNIFAPQLETALKYREMWSESYSLPEDTAKAEVLLSIKRPWREKKELLFKKIVQIP